MQKGGFVMQKQDRKVLTAVLTVVYVLFWSALAPQSPRAAWWCTAFSITCEEAAAGKDAGNSEKIEFRSFLVDLFRHKDNT
jgi:hypothetical protein